MSNLTPVDIAHEVGMSNEVFAQLTQKAKRYYFYIVHYGPDCDQIDYILNH